METDEDAEPTITITEADARVAAFRQLASDAVLENHMNSRSCKCDSEIIEALPASDAALKVVVAQERVMVLLSAVAYMNPEEDESRMGIYLKYVLAVAQAELAAAKRDLEAQR